MLGNRFFKLFAQGRFVIAAKEHILQPLPYSSVAIFVGYGFDTVKTVALWHGGNGCLLLP
jgi:hypothetical protein